MKGPKNGLVKASFSGCPVNEREKFKDSHAMILVSVGQSYHEGEKMIATLDLVSRKFEKYTVLVADTLQRHNIEAATGLSTKDALYLAKKKGEEWTENYKEEIQKRDGFYGIKKWDDYLSSKKFEDKLSTINKKFDDNQHYISKAIEKSVHEYMQRGDRIGLPEKERKELESKCATYLKEECAAMLLWIEDGFNYEVYPTPRNDAMAATYENLIEPYYQDILKPVSLRFKRYSKKTSLA